FVHSLAVYMELASWRMVFRVIPWLRVVQEALVPAPHVRENLDHPTQPFFGRQLGIRYGRSRKVTRCVKIAMQRYTNFVQVVLARNRVGRVSEPVDERNAEAGDYQHDRNNNHNVDASHFKVIITWDVPLQNSAHKRGGH